MTVSKYTSLSKREIVESQLKVAIDFYLLGIEYPSVITLAGAVEEILGKTLRNLDQKPSIEKNYDEFCVFYREMWNEEAPDKTGYIKLKNEPRNQMKHLMSCDEVTIDYEFQAGLMLMRAYENYNLCYKSHFRLAREFNKKRLQNWRNKNGKSL